MVICYSYIRKLIQMGSNLGSFTVKNWKEDFRPFFNWQSNLSLIKVSSPVFAAVLHCSVAPKLSVLEVPWGLHCEESVRLKTELQIPDPLNPKNSVLNELYLGVLI